MIIRIVCWIDCVGNMSSGNATIISPMISKQIIKQEIIKQEEEENCILYISSSRNNLQLGRGGEDSLDVKNGHNYTSATKASNQNTSAQTLSLQRDRLNTVTTTANRSSNLKRIEFSLSKQQSNISNNNVVSIWLLQYCLIAITQSSINLI